MIDPAAKRAMRVTSTSILSVYANTNVDFSLIQYTKATKDYMVPSVWGAVDKKDDPYAPSPQGGCCTVM
jgi:hypothetical protein